MKSLTLIVLVSLSLAVTTQSQEKYLSITAGYTSPLGVFSQSDINDTTSGFAKNGYNLSFEMTFFFNDFVGLGANLRFNNCGFDEELFNELLITKYEGNQLESINLESGNYSLHNFLFGPYIKGNIFSNFSLYAKVFIGVMTSYRSNQLLTFKRPGVAAETIESVGKYSGSFGYNFGAGALVKFSHRVGIRFSADYIAGNPKFDDFNYKDLVIARRKQSVSFMNYNAGLLLEF